MFDTLLLITLFLLASLHVCLLTLFMSLFPFITDINGFFEIPTPHLLNLRTIFDPPLFRLF